MSDQENLTNSSTKRLPDPKRNGTGGWVLLLFLSLAALAFAWFVWPTRYRYDRLDLSNGASYPLRMDRFSGKTEGFFPPRGWVELGAQTHPNPAKQEDQPLPLEELQKLSGRAEANFLGLKIYLYNGSDWTVNEITVDFVIPNKQQGEIRRRYRIKNAAEPLQTTTFQTELNSWPTEGQKWGWNLVEAKGTKQ